MNNEYIRYNQQLWNEKTKFHLQSAFYNNDLFLAGKNTLNAIELNMLGNVKGKSILHLQCHFGQDTISLARMGAEVTGIDFSDAAISAAREMNVKTGQHCNFICCDVYSLKEILHTKFDICFTSYGTIGWLPDLQRWGDIIAHFLKPGGKFVFAEFHPVVWMFADDFSHVAYSYFNREPIIEESVGTYADRSAPISNKSITWNHHLSEVISALLNNGLKLTEFCEFDYSPYNCLLNMEEFEPGKYRIKGFGNALPLVYALSAES